SLSHLRISGSELQESCNFHLPANHAPGSIMSKCNEWINPRRSPCGYVSCQHSDNHQPNRNPGESGGVCRGESKQKSRQKALAGKHGGNTKGDASECKNPSLAKNHNDDTPTTGTERHADADLCGAADNRISHHAE